MFKSVFSINKQKLTFLILLLVATPPHHHFYQAIQSISKNIFKQTNLKEGICFFNSNFVILL